MNGSPQRPFSNYGSPNPVSGPRPKLASRWKKAAVWIWAGFNLLTLLSAIAISVLLRTQWFHAYLLRTAQQKASDALGSRAQMRDFAMHWSGLSPTVDLYGVVIEGAAPYSDPPLLQTDAIHLGVTVTSLLHKTWYVGDIRIEHPVVHIFADNHGRTNLPAPKNAQPSAENKMDVFDLGIRHLLLERGEIYYNNRKSELSADVHELALQSSFALVTKTYSGSLSYRDGHLQLQNSNSISHNFNARFSATPKEFKLEQADLAIANSKLSVAATVRSYSQPELHATYQAQIDARELGRALNNPALPAGTIQSSGVLDCATQPNQSLLATLNANGEVHSAKLAVNGAGVQVDVQDIGARYSVAKGNAALKGIQARLLGGALNGTLLVHDLAGATKSHLSATLKDVSLSQLQSTVQSAAQGTTGSSSAMTRQIALRGSLNATVDANWSKTLDDLLAQADATIQANAQPAQGGAATPMNGVIHAQYAARTGQLSLSQSYLRTAQTSVVLNGTISRNAALHANVTSNDLHELETISAAFRSPGSEPIGLYGRAALSATISGSTRNPQVAGQLTANDLRVRGTSWKILRANLSASPSQIRIENGQLDSAARGRVTFNVVTALQQWSLLESSPFQLQVNASQLNAADLVKAAGSTAPVSGTISADFTASGTQLAPVGHGTIKLASANISGESIRSVDLEFQGTGKQLNANLKADLPAGSLNATLAYDPASHSYQANLRAPGFKLDQLETVKARDLQLHGVLDMNASGEGTIQDPQLQAAIEIPQLKIRDQVIQGLKLQARVENHLANFTLDSDVLNTHAGGHGTVELRGDYVADASIDTKAIPLAPLVALYAPSQDGNVTGQSELHATIHGPLKDKTRLEAHLIVPQLMVNYKNSIQLAATAPIRADYANGILNLQRSTIRGTGTEVTFQAKIPAAKDAPASLLVQGSVDLRLAQIASPDITSSGQLRFDIDSFGRRSDPNVQGQIQIVNASFTSAGAPVGLQNGNGVLTLTRDRLDVKQFQGHVGGGTVSASGGIVYRPQLQFDLALAGNGVRILYDQSVRTTIGSNLALTGSFDNAALTGQVRIDQLSFTSDFDISDLMSQFGGEETPPPTQGFTQNLNLDVGIQTPGGINLASRTLSLSGSANLRLRGTAAQPVLLGRLNLSEGDLIFSGNRYKVQGGTIDFTNSSHTEPVVDMSVNTTIAQYDLQMHFWGPADHLHTNYASDPSLPPADIINLIAFGKTSEASAANPTPPGTLGAESLVASQVSNQITNRVEKLAGISQLSVDPQLGSSQQSPGARVTVQQKVTSKVFVTFSTDVTSTDSQVVQLEYQLNRRTSLSAVRDQNGGFSFQVTRRRRW